MSAATRAAKGALLEKVRSLETKYVGPLDVLITDLLRHERRSPLLLRLEAIHQCADMDLGFQQLPPSGSGARQWTCRGCNALVELPRKGGA